jgi:hypothetical protein
VPPSPLSKQSGYVFKGVSGITAPLDGTEFKLGTFTHENLPIGPLGAQQFKVFIKLTLTIDQGGPSREFRFGFDHNETPNEPNNPVPDEVVLPSLHSEETITLDGKDYALQITGFRQNGKLVTKLISQEDNSNSADLFAKLVAVPAKQPAPQPLAARPQASVPEAHPAPQPPAAPFGIPEEPCRVKNVVDTGSLFALTLERLNRRSVVHLLEQLITEVNAHCEKITNQPDGGVSSVDLDKLRNELLISINELRQSSQSYLNEAHNLKQQISNVVVNLPQTIHQTIHNVNIENVTNQIEVLNNRLVIIQKAAQELDGTELKQVEILLVKLLQKMDFHNVVQNISINVGGRSVDLRRLLEVLATADRVLSINIQYGDLDHWEITGARFVLSDLTQIFFNVRILPDPTGLRIIYLFETNDWKGLPAQFKFVFLARKTSYTICANKFNVDSYDGVEQTNVVFDLCSQFSQP